MFWSILMLLPWIRFDISGHFHRLMSHTFHEMPLAVHIMNSVYNVLIPIFIRNCITKYILSLKLSTFMSKGYNTNKKKRNETGKTISKHLFVYIFNHTNVMVQFWNWISRLPLTTLWSGEFLSHVDEFNMAMVEP